MNNISAFGDLLGCSKSAAAEVKASQWTGGCQAVIVIKEISTFKKG